MSDQIKLSIEAVLMGFIREQAEAARRDGAEEAGLLDAQHDLAYAQLTKSEIGKTERALDTLLASHAGHRRLAAILSIAIKAAMGEI